MKRSALGTVFVLSPPLFIFKFSIRTKKGYIFFFCCKVFEFIIKWFNCKNKKKAPPPPPSGAPPKGGDLKVKACKSFDKWRREEGDLLSFSKNLCSPAERLLGQYFW